MITKTSTFCHKIPEKNQIKDTYPLKKRKKSPNFVHFKILYSLLLGLCRPQKVTQKLERHIIANGPHLVRPQQGLEVSQPHILGAISCYFRTVILKDPVVQFCLKDKPKNLFLPSFIYIIHFIKLMSLPDSSGDNAQYFH